MQKKLLPKSSNLKQVFHLWPILYTYRGLNFTNLINLGQLTRDVFRAILVLAENNTSMKMFQIGLRHAH